MFDIIVGSYLVFGFILFWFTYFCYVLTMKAKNNEDKIRALPKWQFYPLALLIILVAVPGYIGDILWRILYGTVIWLEFPKLDFSLSIGRNLNNLTLTHLIRKTLDGRAGIEPGDIRYQFSMWLCKNFLEPHDPGHCGKGYKDE